MNARAFGYLKKPFDVDALIVAIHAGSRHGRTIEHRQFLERA
jgi:DNA-binding response OmpR family regulator